MCLVKFYEQEDKTAATEVNGIFDSVLHSPQSSKTVVTYFHIYQHLVHTVTEIISLSQRNCSCLYLTLKLLRLGNFAEICFHMLQNSQVNRYYKCESYSV